MTQRRSLGLCLALALTLAMCAWLAVQPEVEPVRSVTQTVGRTPATRATVGSRAQPANTAAPIQLPLQRVSEAEWSRPTPQAIAAWGLAMATAPASAPPPPPPHAPAPQPVAPPFPYQWIGRLDDGAVSQALLTGQVRTIAVKAGDLVDGQWRVEKLELQSVQLTWLPGNLPQTVSARPLGTP